MLGILSNRTYRHLFAAQLIALIVTINSWNRIAVTSRLSPAPKQA